MASLTNLQSVHVMNPLPAFLKPVKRAMARQVGRRLARNALAQRPALIVLLYHQVCPDPPGWLADLGICVHPTTFEAHLQSCLDRFPIVRLTDGLQQLRDDQLKQTSVAITFDDAMTGISDYADPILERLGIPATVFVNRDFTLGGQFWCYQTAWLEHHGHGDELASIFGNTTRSCYREYLRHDADEQTLSNLGDLRDLYASKANGECDLYVDESFLKSASPDIWEFGNHSCSHPRFSRLSDERQQSEIFDNSDYLSKFDHFRKLFAVPFGRDIDWNGATVAAALSSGHEFISAYGGVNLAGRVGVDIRRIPADSIPADGLEDQLVESILNTTVG